MSIISLLEDNGVYVKQSGHHHCTEGWAQMDCPFCSPNSGRYRLGLNIRGGYLNCWSCGRVPLVRGLSALTLLQEGQVRRLLTDLPTEQVKRVRTKGTLKLPSAIIPIASPHRRYLEGRGFDVDSLIKLWDIKGIGVSTSRCSWSIFIPIHYQGEVVSWTTRRIVDTGRRYRSAHKLDEAIPHKELLYGEDYCRNAVIVCEGPLDVWRLGPGAVATFGVDFTAEQVLKIAKYPVRVIMFDYDARRQADKLAEAIEVLPGETYVIRLNEGDPGSISPKKVKEIRSRFLE